MVPDKDDSEYHSLAWTPRCSVNWSARLPFVVHCNSVIHKSVNLIEKNTGTPVIFLKRNSKSNQSIIFLRSKQEIAEKKQCEYFLSCVYCQSSNQSICGWRLSQIGATCIQPIHVWVKTTIVASVDWLILPIWKKHINSQNGKINQSIDWNKVSKLENIFRISPIFLLQKSESVWLFLLSDFCPSAFDCFQQEINHQRLAGSV